MAVRLVTVVWVYPNNRDKRVSCVYANTPRAWCKYIWVGYFQFFSSCSQAGRVPAVKYDGMRRRVPATARIVAYEHAPAASCLATSCSLAPVACCLLSPTETASCWLGPHAFPASQASTTTTVCRM